MDWIQHQVDYPLFFNNGNNFCDTYLVFCTRSYSQTESNLNEKKKEIAFLLE